MASFLDDLMEGAGRAASAATGALQSIGDVVFSGHNDMRAKTARSAEISRFAQERGYRLGSMDPQFARDYPEMAAEANDIAMSLVAGMGTGAVGAFNRGVASAPGTLGAAAAAARRPQQPGLPGMGSSQGTMPAPQFHTPQGRNPNTPPATNPPSSQPPLPGMAGSPVTPPPAGAPPFNPPPASQMGPPPFNPPPAGPQPFNPPPASQMPGAANGPGFLQNIATWARNNPTAAAAAGLGALATGVAAGGAAAIRQNRAEATPEASNGPSVGPDMNFAPDIGEEYGDRNAAAAAERRRRNERNEMSPSQIAEQELTESQAAYANAQRAELERRMQNSDMTDSEKEAARQALETRLAQIREQGANDRSAAQIAADARNTDVREAGEDRRTGVREAGEDRRTGMREAGATTRAAYQGQVEMRGQDQRSREAEGQFISSMLANRIAEGKLSLDKADKVWEAYIKQAKLPSDILRQVSDAITPMLPYMTNGRPGDTPVGMEDGGAFEQLWKASGGKGKPPKSRGYSDFSLTDLAARYGGGPDQQRMPPRSVDEVFQGAGTVAPETIQNPNSVRDPRPEMPPAVGNLAPNQVVAPMDPEAERRIYNSIR